MINLGDSVFFHFTQKRSTIDVIKFIFISDDVLKLLPEFIIDYWYLSFVLFAIIFGLIWTNKLITRKTVVANKMTLKLFFSQLLVMILLLGLSLIGARGGLQLRPLSIMHATTYTDAKKVPIILNTPFTLMTTFGHEGILDVKYFDAQELKKYYDVLKIPAKTSDFDNKNVVIILLESFSKEYVGSMNNYKGYTPFLDSLMRQSMVFTNAYSNGYRSMDAIPAAVTSIPCLMDDPIITSVYANNTYTTLPKLLKEKSYHTAFFHGGNNGTLGLDGFAKYLGFDNYYGRSEYGNDEDFDGYWGIFDEPFLQFMISKLDEFSQPFLAMEFTLSSHYPYALPPEYENTFMEGPLRIHRVVRYTDHALMKFFKVAQTKEWFNNTIFIISADHPAQSVIVAETDNIFEKNNLPDNNNLKYYKNTSGRYAIPILIYAPGDTTLRGEINNTVQQADIMPTVLSILNYDKEFIALGSNMLDSTSTKAVFHYVNGLYQVTSNHYCLLFDGAKSTALYAKSDLNHSNNLLKEDTQTVIKLENLLKAYLQEYSQRMRNNNLELN